MQIERRFSNMFRTGEAAHAFETQVKGAAIEAGLSLGPDGIEDLGLPGIVVRLTVSGDSETLDRLAERSFDGTTLEPSR